MATKGKIDWASKRLGDGTAVDVPKYLLALQSSDEKQRAEAARWLTSALLDGGSYPDIGPLVVSALIEMMQGAPDPALVIQVVVEVSLFGHATCAVTGVTPKKFRGPLKKAYETFCAARSAFEGLLNADEPRTRAAAAFALAFIADKASETSEVLQSRVESDSEALVVASCLLAMGLTVLHGAPPSQVVETQLTNSDGMIRTAAAVALGVNEAKPTAATTVALVEGLLLPRSALLWFEGRLSFYALRVLVSNAEHRAGAALPALTATLSQPEVKELDEYAQLMLADATIEVGFARFAGRSNNPVTRGELSDEQLELLKHLEALGRRTATFAEYGLPREPSAIALLTASAPAPLDRVVEVAVDGNQRLPIWKCLHLVFERKLERDELSKALRSQVPKAELFGVLVEACSGKNDVPVLPPPITIECLDYLGADAVEPGRKLAEQLAKSSEPYSPGLAILSLNALVRNGVTTLPDEFGAVAARLSRARTPLGLEEVVASLSADARAKFQLQG